MTVCFFRVVSLPARAFTSPPLPCPLSPPFPSPAAGANMTSVLLANQHQHTQRKVALGIAEVVAIVVATEGGGTLVVVVTEAATADGAATEAAVATENVATAAAMDRAVSRGRRV